MKLKPSTNALAPKPVRQVPLVASHPLEPGNIDLFKQPEVMNPSGSISTVDTSGYNLDGFEVLLPSVTSDGRHLVKPDGTPDDDAIIAEYYRTGRHLGKFRIPEESNIFAGQLHRDYEAGRYRQVASPGALSSHKPINAMAPIERRR